MQVFEHEHRLAARCPELQHPAPRRERLFLRDRLSSSTHQGRRSRAQPGPVGVVPGQCRLQLRCCLLWRVRFPNAGLRLDDLAQRPEGVPLSVGQTAALSPTHELRLRIDELAELRDQPALADARLADNRHQSRRPLRDRRHISVPKPRQLRLSADQWRRVLGAEARAEAGAGRERTPDLERFRLPLDLRGLELLVFERAFREPVGGFADRDSADRGDRLESRRRVHDVSGDDALAAVRSRVAIDHRFAGLDSNPHTQLEVGLGCVQLLDRIQDP